MRTSIYFIFAFVLLTYLSTAQSPPTVSGETAVCSGNGTSILASGENGAIFNWYDAAQGGNLLSSTSEFVTPNLSSDTYYYVEQTTGAGTSSRTEVLIKVAVIPSPTIPTNVLADPPSICEGESSNLAATVDQMNGQRVHWYDAEVDGSLLAITDSGETFTVNPSESRTYYAQSQLVTNDVIFNYTGAVQTFVVPDDITEIEIDAYGAQGGNTYSTNGPGLGGRVQGKIQVTPGQTLNIYVGGAGQSYAGYGNQLLGGWNGGGNGHSGGQGGGGGGATDIRVGGTTLQDRILVAGGAGGKGPTCSAIGYLPHGGGLIGGAGSYCSGGSGELKRGLGGSQTGGGRPGCWYNGSSCGTWGGLGYGGNGGSVSGSGRSGGGGGGYYGGGGGTYHSDGGGGSSYTASNISDVIHTQGMRNGHGMLKISYSIEPKDCAEIIRKPVTVAVEDVPVVVASDDTYNCPGNGVEISAQGADTYVWEPGGMTGSTITVDPGSTTTYTVIGTTGNCSSSDQVTVIVSALSTSGNVAICEGQSTTLSASGYVTYTWDPGNVEASSIVVNPTMTTTYSLFASDPSGCFASDVVVVTVNPLPELTISNDTLITKGSSADLSVTGADSYTWNPGGLSGSNVIVSPEVSTVYTATGQFTDTGCSSSGQVEVSVIDLPQVMGNTIVGKGGTTSLSATGESAVGFFWYNAAEGGSPISSLSTFETPVLNENTTFYVSLYDGVHTSDRKAIHINVIDPIVTSFLPEVPIACEEEEIELEASFIGEGPIHWYDAPTDGNLLATSQNNEATALTVSGGSSVYAIGEAQAITETFSYTGSTQMFVVPTGITSINIDAYGAQGGNTYNTNGPGRGGRIEASMNVSPGDTIYVYVGGQGQSYAGFGNTLQGGWNGGGDGHSNGQGGGGGGATDIRIGGVSLHDRVLVAGGAGGKGVNCSAIGYLPHGGGLVGGAGSYCTSGSGELRRGLGGSQTGGGRPGCWYGGSSCGTWGGFGYGGRGGSVSGNGRSGGGGGGYYGGGGGTYHGDGGGGSSYADPALHNVIHTQGVRSGHGLLTISYSLDVVTTQRTEIPIMEGDITEPIAVCEDLTIDLNEESVAVLEAAIVGANSTDNCGTMDMSVSQGTFTCASLGETIPVTLTVTDDYDNSSTCVSQVTIVDAIDPGQRMVKSSSSSGNGSFYQTVRDACPGDVIGFDPSLENDTIDWTLHFLTKDLTLAGLGMDKTIVSGRNTETMFYIYQGAEVSIRNMTIIDGRRQILTSAGDDPVGAGIHVTDGTVHIENVKLANNFSDYYHLGQIIKTEKSDLVGGPNGLINMKGEVIIKE